MNLRLDQIKEVINQFSNMRELVKNEKTNKNIKIGSTNQKIQTKMSIKPDVNFSTLQAPQYNSISEKLPSLLSPTPSDKYKIFDENEKRM
jgi:hypothetical protein